MVLDAIKVITLQDSVYEKVMRAIVSGKIAPGQRITIEGLASELDVSAMPVREAIRRLEANGLVSVNRRRITVRQLSPNNVHEILEVRLLLECHAAANAAKNRSRETLDRLGELVGQMDQPHDPESYLKMNKQFHDTLYSDCGLPVIQEFIDSLWERYSPYLHILLQNDDEWHKQDLNQNHRKILKGMQRKDPVQVRKYLEKDLSGAASNILKMLEQGKASAETK
jgi:DNA-binding GntR family transcriptional regulator